MLDFFHDKTILVTGGAGSIASELVKQLCELPIHSVRVFDHDEHSLDVLQRNVKSNKIRVIMGDVRDRDKVRRVIRDCDIVIHTSAIKNINISEYNMDEAIETNVNGFLNVIRACIYEEPEILCNLSSDKAVNPTTLYGATKFIDEKLVSWIDKIVRPMRAYNIRFGNIIETRGNLFEIWREQDAKGEPRTITDLKMERYFMHVDECASKIIKSLTLAKGGETFVPKMQLYQIKTLLEKCPYRIIGLRSGEKLGEQLLSEEELMTAKDIGDFWIIP